MLHKLTRCRAKNNQALLHASHKSCQLWSKGREWLTHEESESGVTVVCCEIHQEFGRNIGGGHQHGAWERRGQKGSTLTAYR